MAKFEVRELRDEIAFLTNLIKSHKQQQAAPIKSTPPNKDCQVKWPNTQRSETGKTQTHTQNLAKNTTRRDSSKTCAMSVMTANPSQRTSTKQGHTTQTNKTKFKWTAPVLKRESSQLSLHPSKEISITVNHKSQPTSLHWKNSTVKTESKHLKLDNRKVPSSRDKKDMSSSHQKADVCDAQIYDGSFKNPSESHYISSASELKSSHRSKHKAQKNLSSVQTAVSICPKSAARMSNVLGDTSVWDHKKQKLLSRTSSIVVNNIATLCSPLKTSTPANSATNTPNEITTRMSSRPPAKPTVPGKNKYKYVRQSVSPIISQSPRLLSQNSATTSSVKSMYVIRKCAVIKTKLKPITSKTRYKLIRKTNQDVETTSGKSTAPMFSSHKPQDSFSHRRTGDSVRSMKCRSYEAYKSKNITPPTIYTYTQRSRFRLVKKAVRLSRKRLKHEKTSHSTMCHSPNKTWNRDTARDAKMNRPKTVPPSRKLFNASHSRFKFRKYSPSVWHMTKREWRPKPVFPSASCLKIDHRGKGASLSTTTHNALKRVAHQVLQRSIHTAVIRSKKRNTKCRQYCVFFSRFGRCHHGTTCPNIHDPKRVAICRRFLQGRCRVDGCLFSHQVAKEKVPVCHFFLKGACSREDCPYLHVNVSKDAGVCAAFLNDGYCPLADKCCKKHVVPDCEEFTKQGSCKKGRQCKLRHNRKQNNRKRAVKREQRTPVTRDHSSAIDDEEEDDRHLPLKLRKLPAFITLSSSPPRQEPPHDPPKDPPSTSGGTALLIKPRLSF